MYVREVSIKSMADFRFDSCVLDDNCNNPVPSAVERDTCVGHFLLHRDNI